MADHEGPEPVVVTLRPWEYEHAADVGIRRYTANWSRSDARYYDRQRRGGRWRYEPDRRCLPGYEKPSPTPVVDSEEISEPGCAQA